VADVLLVNQNLLTSQPDIAEKVARTWFAGVAKGDADKQAAANSFHRPFRDSKMNSVTREPSMPWDGSSGPISPTIAISSDLKASPGL